MQELFVDLYSLSTPDLIKVAHTVASILRERMGRDDEHVVIDEEAARFCQALREAGARGVQVGSLRAVLTPMPLG